MRVVAGTYGGFLYGWENNNTSDTLKLTYGYRAHTSCIKSTCFLPEKKNNSLLTGGADEMIKIYNLTKRVEVGVLMQHTNSVTALVPYSKTHVLSGAADNTICIWRVSDWNCVHILGGHKEAVNDLAVHPSGKMALSVSRDKTLRMWNLIKGRSGYIRKLEDEALKVEWSPSGEAYALMYKTCVALYAVAASDDPLLIVKCAEKFHSVAFVTDTLVAVAGETGSIDIHDITATGEDDDDDNASLVGKITNDTVAHNRVREVKVVTEEESTYVVAGMTSGIVQVYDISLLLSESEQKVITEPTQTLKIGSDTRITCLAAMATTTTTLEDTVADKEDDVADNNSTDEEEEVLPKPAAPKVIVEFESNKKRQRKK